MAGLSLQDLWQLFLRQNIPANVLSGAIPPTDGSSVPNSYTVASAQASNHVVAPAAGALIASATNLTGLYECLVYTAFGAGAPVAADTVNMQLNAAGAQVQKLFTPVTLGQSNPPMKMIARLANQSFDVKAIAIGTAGVDYWATIVATKIAN